MKVVVVGGGCIGLGIAGELGREHEVELFDKGPVGRGASYAAAGMLGPIMEVEFHEPELLELGMASHGMYPDFAKDLREQTGVDPGLRTEGTLYVAVDPPEVEEMNRLYEYQQRVGLDVEKVSPSQAREMEPRITHYVTEAMYTGSDHQIDNRKLVEGLVRRCEDRSVTLHESTPVEEILIEQGTVRGVRTSEGTHEADEVILAAGAWSGRMDGLPEEDNLRIRPVKGQALAVGLSDPPEIEHVVRSPDVYCVPKDDGRLVVGSTMEEEGFDETVRAGGVLDLLHHAYEVLPFVYEQPLLETWAGLRPASHDSLPVMGPSPTAEGLIYATGHYRNGILMTPITIDLIGRWMRTREVPDLMEPFLPVRFQEATHGV